MRTEGEIYTAFTILLAHIYRVSTFVQCFFTWWPLVQDKTPPKTNNQILNAERKYDTISKKAELDAESFQSF